MDVDPGPGTEALASLTRRQREVALAIGRAESTSDIAQRLGISVRTVESHTLHAFRKLGLHNRVELVRWLLRHDAIALDFETSDNQ
jgi:DNA-binding CsgD family transcriptional regulator